MRHDRSRSSSITRRTLLRDAGLGLAGAAGAAIIGCRDAPDRPDQRPHGAKGGLEKTQVRIGYLPITDATPLVLAHGLGYCEEAGLSAAPPTLFRGWSQIAEAFQARQLDVVHLLMPMTIWLRFGRQVPLKVVAWNHTGGSALTVAERVHAVADLAGTTVAIPFWYSIHNVVLQMLLRDAQLTVITTGAPSHTAREVKLVVMSPPDMPPALANGAIAGYIVADPFNAVAEVNRVGRILRFIPDVWFEHACCVVVMHQDDLEQRPHYTQAVVSSVVRAQLFAREHRVEAARLLSSDGHNYLPQPRPVIARALSHYDVAEYGPTGAIRHEDWQTGRIDFQPFPYASYTEELVRQLRDTVVEGDAALLATLDPTEAHRLLVDDRFARVAMEAAGGPERFGLDRSLQRVERIAW